MDDVIAMLAAIKEMGFERSYEVYAGWYGCFYDDEKTNENEGYAYFLAELHARYAELRALYK